jgi:hypothetical protein
MVRLAQTIHLPCNDTNTLSKRIENEIQLEPRHLERSWEASKRISEHLIHFSANRAHILRQDWHYLQTDRNEHPLGPRHLGVPSGASKTISKPIVRLVQTVYLSCTDTNTVSKWTETRFHMTHIT